MNLIILIWNNILNTLDFSLKESAKSPLGAKKAIQSSHLYQLLTFYSITFLHYNSCFETHYSSSIPSTSHPPYWYYPL